MDYKKIKDYGGKVIEIKHEIGWRKPIQATYWFVFPFSTKVFHFDYFSEWDTINDAIEFFSHHHKEPLWINPQIQQYFPCSSI